MLAILFLIGLAATVAGVALVSVPAALVVGGVTLCALALVLERGKQRAARAAALAARPPSGGDD